MIPVATIRLSSELRESVDAWAAKQSDKPARPEAIRRLVELGLASTEWAGAGAKKAAKASEMASQEIDRLGDPLATDEERQLRKRRLISGPKEFRDIRRNRPNKWSTDISMPSHKFHIGESVTLRPAISRNVPGGVYEVINNSRTTAANTNTASKVQKEHERVAGEGELIRA